MTKSIEQEAQVKKITSLVDLGAMIIEFRTKGQPVTGVLLEGVSAEKFLVNDKVSVRLGTKNVGCNPAYRILSIRHTVTQ